MPDSRTLPEHVTLPLLTLVTRNSLDEDYQHVADRKAEAGRRTASLRRGGGPRSSPGCSA